MSTATDGRAFHELASAWRRLLHEQDAELQASWVPAMRGMVLGQRDLTKQGEWVSGPSSIMGVLGFSRAEVVNCRMVRWLFDPLARHGLGSLMIEALAEHLGFDAEESELAVVEAEVPIADTRADVVITFGSQCIVIEAKIDAGEGRRQAERIETHWPDADPLVFLTTGGVALPATASDPARWRPLPWVWLADAAAQAMERRPVTSASKPSRAAIEAWIHSARKIT